MPYELVILLLVLVAAAGTVWVVASARRRPRVICLMYHRFAPRDAYEKVTRTERVFTLPADVFEEQIAHLAAAGFTFVTPDEVRRFVRGELNLPDPSVLLTFDDGCVSVDQIARPVLERHGARGTMFVTTDPSAYVFEGGDRRMTDDELRAVDGDVLQFESHTVTHQPLRGQPEEVIRTELAESKRELERILSRPVEYLAIPGNWFDRRVMRIAREVGYRAVWYSYPGVTRKSATVFGLPRINVEGQLSAEQFATVISPFGIGQRRLVSWIKRVPGRLLGPKVWLPLRKVILACIPGGYVSTRRILAVAAVVVVLLGAVFVGWLLS